MDTKIKPGKNLKVDREYRPLVAVAVQQGWQLVPGARHSKLVSPDGKKFIGVSGSCGDRLGPKKFRADLRRAGVNI